MSPEAGEIEPIASSRSRRSAKPAGLGFERSNSRTASIPLLDMDRFCVWVGRPCEVQMALSKSTTRIRSEMLSPVVAACLVTKEHARRVRCGASAAPASPRVWYEDQRRTFDEAVRRLQTESPSPNEQRSAFYLRRRERTSQIGLARNTQQNCSPKAANAGAGRKVPSPWTLVWREA